MVYDSRIQSKKGAQCCCSSNTKTNPSMHKTNTTSVNIDEEFDLTTKDSPINRKLSALTTATMNEKESSWLMDKLGAFLLSSWITKSLVICIFIAYLSGATIGILQLEAYQNPEDLAPTDSYLRAAYESTERYFNSIGAPVQFIMDKPLDYSDPVIIDNINEMVKTIRNDECFLNDSAFTTSWIHSYVEYLRTNYPGNESLFYDILYHEYLVSAEGVIFIQDIWDTVITHEKGLIAANHTDVFSEDHIGDHAYSEIDKSRMYLSLKPSAIGSRGIKACLDNFKRLQSQFDDDLGNTISASFVATINPNLCCIVKINRNVLLWIFCNLC